MKKFFIFYLYFSFLFLLSINCKSTFLFLTFIVLFLYLSVFNFYNKIKFIKRLQCVVFIKHKFVAANAQTILNFLFL